MRFNEFPASKFPPQETLRFLENKMNCFPQDQSFVVITVEIVWEVKGKVCTYGQLGTWQSESKFDISFEINVMINVFLIIWLSLLTYSLPLFTSQM